MKKTVVIKIGGQAASAESALTSLVREMHALSGTYSFVFVHGGGAEVTRVSEVFKLKAVFKDGIRQTSREEMDIVDMVLSGKMNTAIVRLMNAEGLSAVGLNGNDSKLFTGLPIAEGSHTGKIKNVNSFIIDLLTTANIVPVISSVSMTEDGIALNINADEAAEEIAVSLKAPLLIYISDTPGVLKNNEVISVLDGTSAKKEIADGVIAGGMIPKVKSSLDAVRRGAGMIVISNYGKKGDLKKMLAGLKGTRIQ